VKLLLIVFLSSILMVASISIFVSAVQAESDGGSRVISVLGIAKVQGEDVIVDILVEVQHGQNAKEVARAALQAQNARPFESASLGSAGFTVTGLVWDNLPVVQNYNPGSDNTKDEPASLGGNGQQALTSTHATWDGVATSFFDINFGEITTRCPSLVDECKGLQFFDGNNDVAWLRLKGNILGVAWSGTSIDEVDMALSTRFNWNDGCVDVTNSFDAQTVFLHENGHTIGLGHSDDTGSVMQKFYHGADCDLGTDDEEGITYLYDSIITGSVSGTVIDGTTPIEGATVVLEDTSLSATTATDGTYTISGVPDPVTYDVTASAEGFESQTISRLTVDGAVAGVNLSLTSTGGGGDGDGGLTGTLDVLVTINPSDPFVNKDLVHIFVTVTQNPPVEGAAVHLRIVTPNPRSDLVGDFTTDADGEVHTHYKVKAGRDGTGTYHVHAEASKDLASGECLENDACHADFDVN